MEYELPDPEGSKEINVELREDKLKAFLEIKINPGGSYELKTEELNGLTVISAESQKKIPAGKKTELRQALAKKTVENL